MCISVYALLKTTLLTMLDHQMKTYHSDILMYSHVTVRHSTYHHSYIHLL